jgi:fibronectin type 3 domain-containing protein
MLSWPSGVRADVYINRPYVTLTWTANPDPDLDGYEVFRANSSDGPYAKAHEGLIPVNSWTDTNVSDGFTYYYKLRAVDLCGNESDFSLPSDAAVIHLPEQDALLAPSSDTDDEGVF